MLTAPVEELAEGVVLGQVLPEAMVVAEACLQACQVGVRQDLCSAMLQVMSASNDYTRKVACARWYQRVAAASIT